jgi:hypothetical protein
VLHCKQLAPSDGPHPGGTFGFENESSLRGPPAAFLFTRSGAASATTAPAQASRGKSGRVAWRAGAPRATGRGPDADRRSAHPPWRASAASTPPSPATPPAQPPGPYWSRRRSCWALCQSVRFFCREFTRSWAPIAKRVPWTFLRGPVAVAAARPVVVVASDTAAVSALPTAESENPTMTWHVTPSSAATATMTSSTLALVVCALAPSLAMHLAGLACLRAQP